MTDITFIDNDIINGVSVGYGTKANVSPAVAKTKIENKKAVLSTTQLPPALPSAIPVLSQPTPLYINSGWLGWTTYSSATTNIDGSSISVTSTGSTSNLYLGKVFNTTKPHMLHIKIRITAGTLTNYKIFSKEGTVVQYTSVSDDLVFSALNVWHEFYIDLKTNATTINEIDIVKSVRAIGDSFDVDTFEVYGIDAYPDWSATAHNLLGALSTPEIRNKTVAPSGGQYTTITAALASITDASAIKIYNIVIYPGTYNEINVTTKDYVNLIGFSQNRADTIINGFQAATTSNALIASNSTVVWATQSDIKNLTILAQNMRYPVHWDGATLVNKLPNMDNCYVEHLGNDTARQNRLDNAQDATLVFVSENGLGSGTYSGQIANITNSIIKATNVPFAMHNNINFNESCIINLDTCELIATRPLGYQYNGVQYLPWPGYSVVMDSLGSVKPCYLNLKNVKYNGRIQQDDSSGGWLGTPNPTTHIEWVINITGGSEETLYQTNTVIAADLYKQYVNYDYDTNLFNTTASPILRGMALAYNTNNMTIRPMVTADAANLFIGIALEDIAVGAQGRVRKHGLEKDTFVYPDGVITAALGTSYGISTTIPGAFKVGATPTIAAGVGANVIKY